MIYLYLQGSFSLEVFGLLILAQVAALLLDRLLGEPTKFHPLVGFGKVTAHLEKLFNRGKESSRAVKGIISWLILVAPITLISAVFFHWLATSSTTAFWVVSTLLLYLTIGLKSLGQHAAWVMEPLRNGELEEARQKVSWLVSRNTEHMDETQISKACIESVLENGNDAVFGALFWFLIAGAPGAILYRLTNTLDACWGYRSERFKHFGWWSARSDDWFNLVPARICAASYSLCGNSRNAAASWKRAAIWRQNEGRLIGSPNAGIVMASGAGALNLALGGTAVYSGTVLAKPVLGHGRSPASVDIPRSFALLNRSILIFISIQAALYLIFVIGHRAIG